MIFIYTYEPNGNITNIIVGTSLNETQDYHYDFLNRLTSANAYTTGNTSNIKYSQQFSYDKVGNITKLNNWITPAPSSTPTNTATTTSTSTNTATTSPTNSPTETMTPVPTDTSTDTPT